MTRREFAVCVAAATAATFAPAAFAAKGTEDGFTGKEGSGMLKGISSAISPDLLKTLAEMGHGDEIVISDAHFPGYTFNPRVIRADGIGAIAKAQAFPSRRVRPCREGRTVLRS